MRKAEEYLEGLSLIEYLNDFDRLREGKDSLEALVAFLNARQEAAAEDPRLAERLDFDGNTFRYWGDRRFSYKTIEGVFAGVQHIGSTFFGPYTQLLGSKLLAEDQDALCFSFQDNYQLIPTLALGRSIKENAQVQGKNPPVLIGGGDWVTRVQEVLHSTEVRCLYEIIDYFFEGPAERGFHEVIEALRNGSPEVESLPNIISSVHLDTHTADALFTRRAEFQRANRSCRTPLAIPNFAGLYDDAVTPTPVLAVRAQRSCPAVCGFCGIGATEGYWQMDWNEFVEQLGDFSQEYGTERFSITDLTLFSEQARGLVSSLSEQDVRLQWDCYMQMESDLEDRSLVHELATGGLRFVQFGLESVSRRTLQEMAKAQSSKNVGRILQNFFKEGIWPMTFYINGFPGSSILDDVAIFPFLEEYGRYALAIKPNIFKLSKGSPVELSHQLRRFSSEDLGIGVGDLLRLKETGELATNLDFEYTNEQSRRSAEAVLRLVERWVKTRHGFPADELLDRFGPKFTESEHSALREYGTELIPINDVVRTSIYHQRLFQPFEWPYINAARLFMCEIESGTGTRPDRIGAYRSRLEDEANNVSHYGLRNTLDKDLRVVYNAIIGTPLLKSQRELENRPEKRKSRPFMQNYEQLRTANPAGNYLLDEAPLGFTSFSHFIQTTTELKERRII